MAACFTHIASRALNLRIYDDFIPGDPVQCPPFLEALVEVGAVAPDMMMIIGKNKEFLTSEELQTFKVDVEGMAEKLMVPHVSPPLPRLQKHAPDSDSDSPSNN